MTSSLLEFLFLLIAHAVAGIYSSTLKYSKKITCIIWGSWVAFQCGLLFYTEYVQSNHVLQFFTGFLLSLIGQYVIFFVTTKGKLLQRVFTILTYSIFFCIAITFFTMIKGTWKELSTIVTACLQGTLLLVIVAYFLCFVCPLCRAAEKNISTGWLPLIFVNFVFIVTIILSSVFPVRLINFRDPTAATFIFLSISIMAVYPVVFSNINSLSEAATKREVEAQNRLLLAQIDAGNAQLEADRQARHDRRHHNLVMLEFANNNDIESVRNYLGDLVECDSAPGPEVRYCENITLNTVLTVYERRAKENGIAVEIFAQASRNMDVLPQELVIVVANLFENAIFATSKLKVQDKRIDVFIKESAQRLLIRIENPCRSNLIFDESLYGIGICSIIYITNKYEGMYDFTAENGIFSAKISINLK